MAFSKGVPLPPRGSAQDRILREVLERDRNEKFAAVRLFAQLLGAGLRLNAAAIDAMLRDYQQELTQTAYHPPMIGAAYRKSKKDRRKKLVDQQLLDRVAKYTVKDEDLPPIPAARRRRR